jgi:hypothetical protein
MATRSGDIPAMQRGGQTNHNMRNVVAGDRSQGTPAMKHATYKWNTTTLEGASVAFFSA